jgi:hypothetical protein
MKIFSLSLAVPVSQKKFVFISARIHPGETNSSYMMRGLLEFITSDDTIAKVKFLFSPKNDFYRFVFKEITFTISI